MCGRTCLTLDPKQILCACKYQTGSGTKDLKLDEDFCSKNPTKSSKGNEPGHLTPEWRSEFNCGLKYTPSYNIAPTDITPVLVAAGHFGNNGQSRLVVPMMWGMIPFWHKFGDFRKHGLATNNCRLERLLESKLYRAPFERGQRCVILCEGFYEWQTTKPCKSSERPAYMIYVPQLADRQIHDKSTWGEDDITLLKMAGLFDAWEDEHGDKIYSYSIITFESSNLMSWLHHRMPAILQTEEDVNDWLDYKRITADKALSVLRPATDLKWHRVSNMVNNSRNKSDQCNKPFDLYKAEKSSTNKNNTLLNWLTVQKRKADHLEENSCNQSDEEHAAVVKTSCGAGSPKRPKHSM